MIYFDNSATSLNKPDYVKQKVVLAMEKYTANAGRSGHQLAQQVAEVVFDTREILKKFFNAKNYNVIFTKNCTEALNLAIFGTLKEGDHVITTMFEHNSVLRPLETLKNKGVEVSVVDCALKDLKDEIPKFIRRNTKMIITTAVSNVTGDRTDLYQIGKLCEINNIIFVVDGAQASGHMDINLTEIGIDMYAFAGHKGLLSITGVGGLLVKKGSVLLPIIFGGTGTESEKLSQPDIMPEGLEAGTLPIIPIISLYAGIEYLILNKVQIFDKERKLGEYLYKKLKNLPFLDCYFEDEERTVFSFNMKDMDCTTIANILNEKFEICVRSGLHCSPFAHKFLGTLSRGGAVRVSIDFFNKYSEIDELVEALVEIKHSNIF